MASRVRFQYPDSGFDVRLSVQPTLHFETLPVVPYSIARPQGETYTPQMRLDASRSTSTGTALDTTFGALLLGTFIGVMLYGLNTHQLFRYFRMFPDDVRYVKLTVFVICLAESLYSVLCIHICYHYLVTGYFHPEDLQTGVWSFMGLTPVLLVIVVTTQAFYVRRIYIVGTKRMRIALVVVVLSMTGGVAFGLAVAVKTCMNSNIGSWASNAWLSSVAFAFALSTDVMITTMMIVYFVRSHTGFESTQNVLNTLILYTINTGMVLVSLGVIYPTLRPKDMIFIAVNMVTTHSYATSVLAIINSRKSLKDMATAATTMELGTYRHRPRSRITPVVSVQVERVTQVFIGQRSTKDSQADVDADFEEDVADVKTSMGSEVGRSDVERATESYVVQ
ncbi:hypothetical protein C8Q76DRAFT_749371 [Earliella scabrosa]|nr:hypothetical protein C8Q76DRAFT_749371 [Earliella scabrosa]